VWGIVLIALGLLVLLSFFELAGPFGTGSSALARLLFGMWAFVVPLTLVIAGLTLIGVIGARENPKTLVGTAVLFLGSLSLFHLLTGNLPMAGTEQSVENSGGIVGSLVAYPLERLVGYWGASSSLSRSLELVLYSLPMLHSVMYFVRSVPTSPVCGPGQAWDKANRRKQPPWRQSPP